MLALTKKTDYALIALGYLKEHPAEVVSSREISEHYGMPGYLMMNIMKSLHHADFITSVRGTKGGYKLAAELSKMSLLDLVTALDGPVEMAECVCVKEKEEGEDCKIGKCPIREAMLRLHEKFLDFLRGISLSQLLAPGSRSMMVTKTAATA
jgi:Rrf2 family protein